MKKLLLFVLLFISVVANAQKGISYQAVILDPSKIEIPGQDISGQPFVNGNVSVKFVILSGTTSQFEEVQQTKTDAYGLVNLTIGSAASTAFNALTWDANQKSLQVFVSFNNGGSYTKVSDQKLTYTPYALFSETAGKLGGTLGIAGGGTGAITAVGARANLGLGNVDNTSDAAKPISTATQAALDLKANAADVNAALALKATVAALQAHMAITADTTMLATKAALTDLTNYAPKASPTFTGVPNAPTANPGTNSTQIATTAYTDAAIAVAVASSGIADNSVTSVKIADGTIATADLSNGAITDAKIASVAGSKITGIIPITSGGTGSSTQNFVDLTTVQTIAGTKTFSSNITVNGVTMGRGNGNNGESVAIGGGAMGVSNVNGKRNTAVGFGAMRSYSGTAFDNNTSIGYYNLPSMTTGSGNTSVGAESMLANITGTQNTSIGNQSLISVTGNNNVGVGKRSGQTITSGSQNTIIGTDADVSSATWSNATALGYGAQVTASNSIQLGNNSVSNVKTSGTITAGTITYPNTAGTNGQVLTTNGTVASWVSPSSVTVGTISNTSNINGATITAGVLNLAPADATNGGIVTNGAQTFAGVKTFSDGISYLKTNAAALDQSNPTAANSIGGSNVWQSFTAGVSGKLSSVEFKMISPLQDYSAGTYTVKIYDGEGITGTLLGTTTGIVSGSSWTFFPFDFTNAKISVVSGQLYTIYISTPTLYWANLYVNINDSYASGRASSFSNWDLVFKTYVSPTTVDSYLPLSGGSLSGNLVVGATSATGTSAALEVKSTTQGLLLPRLTTAQRDAISLPSAGLLVYNTSTSKFQGYSNSSSSLQQLINTNQSYGLGYSNFMGPSNSTNGQTFTVASTSSLNSIEVNLNNVSGGNSANVTISVYAGDIGAAYSTFNFSNPIATSTKSINSTGNIQFDFTPISLAPGHYYFNVTCDNMNYRMGANTGGGFSDLNSSGQTVNEIFFQTGGSGYNNWQGTTQALYFKILFASSGWVDLN
jgi:hypothetical protein